MRSKRIAIFVSALKHGGAERVASNLANDWCDAGHKVCLINIAEPDADDYLIDEKITRISLHLTDNSVSAVRSIYMNLKRVKALRKVLKQQRSDTLLTFMTSSNVLGILATLGLPCRIVVSERCHPPNTDAASYWLLLRKWLYARADAIVVLAEESRKWIDEHTGAKSVYVVPNSITWPIPPTDNPVDPQNYIRENRNVLLAVGRLVMEKGYPLLLEAFSMIASIRPDWDLFIVGAGDQIELDQLIKQYSLTDRVFLVGPVGNVADWYACADLYVLSSVSEGFPNSLAEAMASGCAAVSFDCDTGPRDIINNGKNGVLVEAQNVKAMATALSQLMNDKCTRQQLGATAIEVRSTYSKKYILSQWDQLIEEQQIVER